MLTVVASRREDIRPKERYLRTFRRASGPGTGLLIPVLKEIRQRHASVKTLLSTSLPRNALTSLRDIARISLNILSRLATPLLPRNEKSLEKINSFLYWKLYSEGPRRLPFRSDRPSPRNENNFKFRTGIHSRTRNFQVRVRAAMIILVVRAALVERSISTIPTIEYH